jgi:uncharacterized repeat protein (TIGR01451 family)
LAAAGDVNGDGYGDVVIGAPGYDNGEVDEGRAYVYQGSAVGLETTAAWTVESNQTNSAFGQSVSTAGDVNGDGYADVIVGAYGLKAVFAYVGSAAGLGASPAWIGQGDAGQAGSSYGWSVATAGDVNGDGYADVIVGAYNAYVGATSVGRAFAYLGSAAGLGASPAWTAEGDQAQAYFGCSVATAGDVNGDGYGDVIVGAYGYDNGEISEGRAFAYLGSAVGLGGTPAWIAESDQGGAEFGWSVATAGDVNGDGYADVIVGAHNHDIAPFANEGRAFAYLGSAAGLSTNPAWFADGNQVAARFGHSVATAGDVNGDGFAEVIIGARRIDNPEAEEGAAFVFYGNGGPGLRVWPQQRRADDSVPIAPSGASESPDSFRLSAIGRSPFGRTKVRLEWEVKELGVLFDGEDTQGSTWRDTGAVGIALNEMVTGLTVGTPYHWRVRVRYSSARTPFQRAGRWFTVPWNGWNETDLKTLPDANLAVTQVDAPDPALLGDDIIYTLTVSNTGPDAAEVGVVDTLPTGVTFVSAVPSQGSCSEAGGVVRCVLGQLAAAGAANASITVTPLSVDTYTNQVLLSGPFRDPVQADNSSTESTTVTDAIGDRVWEDLNGNGIQDVPEVGMPNVLVALRRPVCILRREFRSELLPALLPTLWPHAHRTGSGQRRHAG